MDAIDAVHEELGDIFQLPLPGFGGVFVVGPEANRLVLTDGREIVLPSPSVFVEVKQRLIPRRTIPSVEWRTS